MIKPGQGIHPRRVSTAANYQVNHGAPGAYWFVEYTLNFIKINNSYPVTVGNFRYLIQRNEVLSQSTQYASIIIFALNADNSRNEIHPLGKLLGDPAAVGYTNFLWNAATIGLGGIDWTSYNMRVVDYLRAGVSTEVWGSEGNVIGFEAPAGVSQSNYYAAVAPSTLAQRAALVAIIPVSISNDETVEQSFYHLRSQYEYLGICIELYTQSTTAALSRIQGRLSFDVYEGPGMQK